MPRDEWEVGEWSDHIGYDCMTGGVRVGPITIDAGDYGQEPCVEASHDVRARVMADAHLIAAAPDMAAALTSLLRDIADCEHVNLGGWRSVAAAKAALAKATGK